VNRAARTTGALAALGATAGAALAARWARRTSATRAERTALLPGDEIVPAPRWQATRAITIEAPPAAVWPWLVQMGYPRFRAGWYAPYWLDRFVWRIRERSATEIVPELQRLELGDRIPDSPDWTAYFVVARIEPERALVLHSTTHPLPLYTDIRFAWSFVLEDEGARTRLVLRARTSYRPVWPAPLVRLFFLTVMNLGDVLEAGAMLHGIRERAEHAARA
jgi:hypothetical protein